METVGIDAGYSDVLESVASASIDLCRHATVAELAESALEHALRLTGSPVAFLTVLKDGSEGRRVYSRAVDPAGGMSAGDIESLFAHAEVPALLGIRSTATQELQAAGETVGTIGVASERPYTDMESRAFALFASQVALAIGLARHNEQRLIVAERARKRFAGQLHDDALQKLTAAEMQLQRMRDPAGDRDSVLGETQELLAQTEDALRRLLFEVRPPALEVPGGFEKGIRERITMLKSLTGAEVEARIELPPDLSPVFRSMLYRQLQEVMANIEKHAGATRVRITLEVRDGGVHGLVEDNGVGFVVADRERLPGHLGLLLLDETATLAGGWNHTQSQPGRGTTVEFWLPFVEEQV